MLLSGVSRFYGVQEDEKIYSFEFKRANLNYFNTNIIPLADTEVRNFDIQFLTVDSNYRNGSRTAFGSQSFSYGTANSLWYAGYGNVGNTGSGANTLRNTLKYVDGVLYINDVLNVNTYGTWQGSVREMYIGANNNDGVASFHINAIMWEITFVHDGNTFTLKPDKATASFKDQFGTLYPIQGIITEDQWQEVI